MSNVYEVIIRNGRIEWTTEPPESLRGDKPVQARLVLVDETPEARVERGRRMARSMEGIARLPQTGLPSDPAQWERQERDDRTLPGNASG